MSLGQIREQGSSMARARAVLPPLLGVVVLLWCAAEGVAADGNVTLEALTIYTTHEWLGRPTVYFRCGGEAKVYLPDVGHKHEEYAFAGEESFQPLTVLGEQKCKRCGFYEQDTVKSDDVFFEGELCPRAFAAQDGRVVLYREKQLNATLLCRGCVEEATAEVESAEVEGDGDEEDKEEVWPTVVVVFLVLAVLVGLGVIAYSKWREKQRRDQQARFVKMFEEDDDLDAELGLKDDDL